MRVGVGGGDVDDEVDGGSADEGKVGGAVVDGAHYWDNLHRRKKFSLLGGPRQAIHCMVAGAREGMRDCLANVAGGAEDKNIGHFGFGRCVNADREIEKEK